MTSTPEQPHRGQQDHPTEPLAVAQPTQRLPLPATPPAPAPERLTPAQQWARYDAAQRATREPALVGAPAAAHAAPPAPPVPPAPAGSASPAAGPAAPPPPPAGGTPSSAQPWGPPAGPAPRRRSRAWLWITAGVVTGLLVGGGAVAAAQLVDGSAGTQRPASLAELGRPADDTVPVAGSTTEGPDWPAVAAAVQDSVVAIDVTTSAGESQGSGVIISDDGAILTNNHVVSGAGDGQVTVTLTDGRILEAEVTGTDASTDLAVIQVVDAPDDLVPAVLGDSDAVTVGESVMAVGNPLGLANTVTTGIVSAVDRPVSTQENGGEAAVTNAIQIDAAVNPGNSGGPLFDAQGQVIGITSSIATLSSESGSIGLGFAIPVNLAEQIAAQLIADGEAEHAFLGVTLQDGTATADDVTRRGAVVRSVTDESPAAEAGLQVDDVIVAIDGDVVGGSESLTAYVRGMSSGDEATLTVVRDGRALEVDVTLATRPDDFGQQEQQPAVPDDSSGLPEGMTPEDLWEWFQQQQEQG